MAAKKDDTTLLEMLVGAALLVGGVRAFLEWGGNTSVAVLLGIGGLALAIWLGGVAARRKESRARKAVADSMVPQHARILDDCLRLCQESKNPKTRETRAQLALEKIAAIEELRPGTITNTSELVRYFRGVVACAETVATFTKAVMAKTNRTRSKNLDLARSIVRERGVTDADLTDARALHPRTGRTLTTPAILEGDDHVAGTRPPIPAGARVRLDLDDLGVTSRTPHVAGTMDRSGRGADMWITPGKHTEVQGYGISGGMIYVGSNLSAVNPILDVEPALIDPRLPVDRSFPDRKGHGIGYWPGYTHIPPACRAAYLEWLTSGRSDPDAHIGYVFLFFYGLERRALVDAGAAIDPALEITLIRTEVGRLLDIYGHNGSFQRYATGLLQILAGEALLDWRTAQPECWRGGQELPADLRLAIGRIAQDDSRLPAAWALAWVTSDPEFRLRTAATRCRDEFEALFRVKYIAHHGEGILLRACKKCVTLEYRPASASFGGAVRLPTDVPDVVSLVGPRRKLLEIATRCTDELDPYSRWLARNPGKHDSLAGTSLLPDEILDSRAPPAFKELKDRLTGLLDERDHVLLPASPLLDEWLPKDGSRLSKKTSVEIAHLFARAGLGVEPDVRFCNLRLGRADHAVVFRLAPGDAAYESPSSGYTAAALLLHLATMVTAADGEVAEDERLMLKTHLADGLSLDGAQVRRLSAHLHLLLAYPPKLGGLKKSVESLTLEQRTAAARFLVEVALADGRVEPAEVRMLIKIYRVLGLDPAGVHDAIHAAQTATVDDGPVLLGLAGRTDSGFAIPSAPAKKPDGSAPQHVGARALDMAAVQAKLSETAAVSSLLSGIFGDEDSNAKVSSSTPRAADEEPTLHGLDAAHTALLKQLGAQPEWTKEGYEQLAESLGLMSDGALEVLNEIAFDRCDAPLAEGDDRIEIDANVYEELTR